MFKSLDDLENYPVKEAQDTLLEEFPLNKIRIKYNTPGGDSKYFECDDGQRLVISESGKKDMEGYISHFFLVNPSKNLAHIYFTLGEIGSGIDNMINFPQITFVYEAREVVQNLPTDRVDSKRTFYCKRIDKLSAKSN